MTLNNLKGEYQILVTEALALKRETRALKPTVRMLFRRRPVDTLRDRVDRLSESFLKADASIGASTSLPGDINGRLSEASALAILMYVRSSVGSLIHECYSDLNELRNHLNANLSLLISVAAILIAVAAFVNDLLR
jgi:hypothetical protein